MSRLLGLLYSLFSYGLFLLVFLYTAAFVCNLWIPAGIDGAQTTSVGLAILIDVALISLFGLQHSIMARSGFKAWLTRKIPQHLERSTYVLVSNLAMIAMLLLWQPIPITLWQVGSPTLAAILTCTSVAGFLLVVAASFLIDHFDLFGVRQAVLHLLGREYTNHPFRTPGLYKFVRHPLYVGWLLGFWVTPHMTVGHLLFAGLLSSYIAVGVIFEERDLVRQFGRQYEEYRVSVPRLMPALAPRRAAAVPSPIAG